MADGECDVSRDDDDPSSRPRRAYRPSRSGRQRVGRQKSLTPNTPCVSRLCWLPKRSPHYWTAQRIPTGRCGSARAVDARSASC